jgi:acyl carrier protein
VPTDTVPEGDAIMTSDANSSRDEELILRDIRALLDQLQLDRERSLTMQSNLAEDLGVDSLALVELCDQLERTFEVSLPDEVFLTATTPQHWLEAVTAARGGAPSVLDVDASSGAAPQGLTSTSERFIAISKRMWSMVTGRASRNARAGREVSNSPSSGVGSILYALYAWALLIPFALAIWSLAVLPMTLPQRRSAGRAVARVTCRALGLSVRVEGKLPTSERPSVIAANHSSFIDGLMLYVYLDQPLTFVSSTDMEHQFLVGRIMRGFGCVFVDRGRAERSAASVDQLVNTIRAGLHLLIFPEGSISAQPGLRVFRLGAFEAAASSNCPVVPVGIRGSREVLRPGSFRPHQGAVRITVGEPVLPAGNEFSDRVVMRDRVRDAIAGLCVGDDS